MISFISLPPTIPVVPFYSQFIDVQAENWKKKSCGIASLAMLIEYYKPKTVSLNTLLAQATSSGAYNEHAGWTYQGLINVSKKYGFSGESYDFSSLGTAGAMEQLKTYLAKGPVMASIHYKFDPLSTIPHLVVIDGIDNDTIYYNDPAAKVAEKQISKSDFLKGWKKRLVVIRPTAATSSVTALKIATNPKII